MTSWHYLVAAFNPNIIGLFWNEHKELGFVGTFPFISRVDYEHKVVFTSNDDLGLISKKAV